MSSSLIRILKVTVMGCVILTNVSFTVFLDWLLLPTAIGSPDYDRPGKSSTAGHSLHTPEESDQSQIVWMCCVCG